MKTNHSVGDLLALHQFVLGPQGGHSAWRQDVAVVTIACAAAMFVVAGVVRLARWRLVGDPHSALVGSALIVMGGFSLPLIGVAAVAGALQHRPLAEAMTRALPSFIVVGLVLRGLRATDVRATERPARLLPLLGTSVLVAFGAMAVLEASLTGPLPSGSQSARLLSAAMVVGWLGLAVAVRVVQTGEPWSRRAAPLFCGLALAEALYGSNPGHGLGAAASLLVCTGVAVLSVRSAHLDLVVALQRTERAIGSLHRTLRDALGAADELTEWRATLVHDAGNSVAGLRAALDVLDSRRGGDDLPTARLCRAAVEEVSHLDHLLHRSAQEPCRTFDLGALVQGLGESAQELGDDVTVRAGAVTALGRPGDMSAVLKNLLANARRHAPGATVELRVERRDGLVAVVCADDGPGLDEVSDRHAFDRGYRGPASVGSGIGLHEARRLMRAQGGDLVLDRNGPGARFVATLVSVAEPASRIPPQRSGPAAAAPRGQAPLPAR